MSPMSSMGLGRSAATSPRREPCPPHRTKIGISAGSGVGMQALAFAAVARLGRPAAPGRGPRRPGSARPASRRRARAAAPGSRRPPSGPPARCEARAPAEPAPRLLGGQQQRRHLDREVARGRPPGAAAEPFAPRPRRCAPRSSSRPHPGRSSRRSRTRPGWPRGARREGGSRPARRARAARAGCPRGGAAPRARRRRRRGSGRAGAGRARSRRRR